MRVLIVGAGAIGIYLGCKLSYFNHDVSLVGRRKLKALGDSISIDDKNYPIAGKTYSIPKNQKFDFVFVASKINDVKNILGKLKKNNIHDEMLCWISATRAKNYILDDDAKFRYENAKQNSSFSKHQNTIQMFSNKLSYFTKYLNQNNGLIKDNGELNSISSKRL